MVLLKELNWCESHASLFLATILKAQCSVHIDQESEESLNEGLVAIANVELQSRLSC